MTKVISLTNQRQNTEEIINQNLINAASKNSVVEMERILIKRRTLISDDTMKQVLAIAQKKNMGMLLLVLNFHNVHERNNIKSLIKDDVLQNALPLASDIFEARLIILELKERETKKLQQEKEKIDTQATQAQKSNVEKSKLISEFHSNFCYELAIKLNTKLYNNNLSLKDRSYLARSLYYFVDLMLEISENRFPISFEKFSELQNLTKKTVKMIFEEENEKKLGGTKSKKEMLEDQEEQILEDAYFKPHAHNSEEQRKEEENEIKKWYRNLQKTTAPGFSPSKAVIGNLHGKTQEKTPRK